MYRPEGRINYGQVFKDPVDISNLSINLDIKPAAESFFLEVVKSKVSSDSKFELTTLNDFKGRWLLVRLGPSVCDLNCERDLHIMRQVRLMTGKNRSRVERIWLISDNKKVPNKNDIKEYEGTWGLRVDSKNNTFSNIFENKDENINVDNHGEGIWLVDPRGLLIMRYPVNPDIGKIHKDLTRLLKVSRIG